MKMEFRKNNPGAVQFGNFINYYNFNSAEERVQLLPHDVWLPFTSSSDDSFNVKDDRAAYLVLDVGCNSGVLTQLLTKFLSDCTSRSIYMLGIDIDDGLIKRAQSENQHTGNVTYACVDVMNNETFGKVNDFLHLHGREKFDAICCFSITMWIHLNHHDVGLQEFLRKLANLSELFVVEPQPWKCYQTAERRLKKSGEEFPLFLDLKWRSNVEELIQNFIEQQLGRRKTYECCPTKWKRRICFYR